MTLATFCSLIPIAYHIVVVRRQYNLHTKEIAFGQTQIVQHLPDELATVASFLKWYVNQSVKHIVPCNC